MGRVRVLGRWRDGVGVVLRRRTGDGVRRPYILGMSSVAMGELIGRPGRSLRVLCAWLLRCSCRILFFKKVRDASRSDYVIPASRPSRKLQAVPGEGFSRAVLPRSSPARRWCTTALVALRGGCPLSRAVRRPALAVTVSSVIRGGHEPLSELSVLARKRSGDRGDLSFPVVTGIG